MTYANAKEVEDFVRGLNKHSGGWATIATQDVSTGVERTETWTATLSRGIVGIVVPCVRKAHGRTVIASNFAAVPKEVREYLLLDNAQWPARSALTVEEFLNLGTVEQRVRWLYPKMRCQVTFTIKYVPSKARQGIVVGCEVGESGNGPDEFLPFPVTEAAVVKAIEDAISYAHDLEMEEV